jgi:hypothetical protein
MGKNKERWAVGLMMLVISVAGLLPAAVGAQGLRLKKEIVVASNGSDYSLRMQVPFIGEKQICPNTSMYYGSLNNANNLNYYDFENDGVPEIIFVHHLKSQGTKIEIYDGATYNLKFTIVVDSASVNSMEGFGGACVGFLDVDGDGVRELVGEFTYQNPPPSTSGYNRLLFIDVRTGKIKYSIQGYSSNYPDGYDGYAFYDIDHDSYPEVLCRWHDSTSQLRLRIYGGGPSLAQPPVSPLSKKAYVDPSNYPNPFTGAMKIEYYVPSPENTLLTVFNTEGRLVRTLVNKKHDMGEYSIFWDGKNDSGQSLGAGQYYYQLKIGAFVSTKKVISLK